MISPGIPSITVPTISSSTSTSSMKATGVVATDWIHAAAVCGTCPKISTHENTPAAATRNSTSAELSPVRSRITGKSRSFSERV